jgi:abortive infection bacteriophage resistance protein
MAKGAYNRLKTGIRKLIKDRQKEERIVLRNASMVSASFCRRKGSFSYLSASIDGQSRHRYIKKAEERYWRKLAEEWKRFSEAIAQWVVINKKIEKKIREYGQKRLIVLPKKRQKRGIS